MYENYLVHYGTLGMRWGRRQKADRPQTKSKRRLRLEEEYRAKGLKPEYAEKAAARRISTEKILLTMGGVAVAGLVTYGAIKYGKEHTDRLLKEGMSIQNMSTNPNKGVQETFYASFKKGDKTKYAGLFSKELIGKAQVMGEPEDVYKMQMRVTKNMKVASQSHAKEALKEVLRDKNDRQELLKYLEESKDGFGTNYVRVKLHDKAIADLSSGKVSKSVYETVNLHLPHRENPVLNKVAGNLFENLKQKGYGALEDINDMKLDGYKAHAPIVVFGGAKHLIKESSEKMAKETIEKLYNKSVTSIVARESTKFGASLTAATLGIIGTVKVAQNQSDIQYMTKHVTPIKR